MRISTNPLLLFIKTSYNIRMKTPMELALARIELMKDISPDSIHWEMFKNDCIEREKIQVINFHVMLMKKGLEQENNVTKWDYNLLKYEAEHYYNQTYNQNK